MHWWLLILPGVVCLTFLTPPHRGKGILLTSNVGGINGTNPVFANVGQLREGWSVELAYSLMGILGGMQLQVRGASMEVKGEVYEQKSCTQTNRTSSEATS